jgi:NAD(P)-dependent dehydrogenase (short-subunit alcohol dehydrogenase family)
VRLEHREVVNVEQRRRRERRVALEHDRHADGRVARVREPDAAGGMGGESGREPLARALSERRAAADRLTRVRVDEIDDVGCLRRIGEVGFDDADFGHASSLSHVRAQRGPTLGAPITAWHAVRPTPAPEDFMPVADFSLEGKVAIVTGGSRGIGRSIAIGLAEHGAEVVIAARKPESMAEAVAALEKTGRRALAVPTNVRRIDELRKLVEETRRELGRIDIVVNNAGSNPVFGPVHEIDEGAWDMIMNTNVKSIHFLSNFAREAMLEHGDGGSIINVSSVGGFLASDVIGGYSVSKAAVVMLTQVQAKNWGEDKIRVNCIAPGLIKTEFAKALWDNPKIRAASESESALRRIGEPDEMAGAVVYLASPAASFVTGQTLILDGGRRL